VITAELEWKTTVKANVPKSDGPAWVLYTFGKMVSADTLCTGACQMISGKKKALM
jgi:hypothetical protein